MMTSSHRNVFHITGPLWGESTAYRWIPLSKEQRCGTLMLSILSPWAICWTNNRHGDDLRSHDAYVTSLYGVQLVLDDLQQTFLWSKVRQVTRTMFWQAMNNNMFLASWLYSAIMRQPGSATSFTVWLLFLVNSSPTGQNGSHFGRRHLQMHFI